MEAQKSPKPDPEQSSEREEREPVDARDRKGDERGAAPPKEKKEEARASAAQTKDQSKPSRARKSKNNVRKLRMERMMSKAELARRANVSTLTVDRVERGMPCRMDTKRKILEALGLRPSDRVMVFGDSPDEDDD